jgi:hypothetical protein
LALREYAGVILSLSRTGVMGFEPKGDPMGAKCRTTQQSRIAFSAQGM